MALKKEGKESMRCLFRAFIILHTSFLLIPLLASAEDIPTRNYEVGGWDLVKILPLSQSYAEFKILKKGLRIELINSKYTFWPKRLANESVVDDNNYCHPEIIGGFKFNFLAEDERLKYFLEKIGGDKKLDIILTKKFKFSTKDFGSVVKMGESKNNREPCKSLSNTNFYVSKDRKSIFIFMYPYIYYFDGGFGEIGS